MVASKLWSNDFHATSGLNRVKIDPPLAGVTHFCHALRPLESLDVRRKRSVLSCKHDGVTDLRPPR